MSVAWVSKGADQAQVAKELLALKDGVAMVIMEDHEETAALSPLLRAEPLNNRSQNQFLVWSGDPFSMPIIVLWPEICREGGVFMRIAF